MKLQSGSLDYENNSYICNLVSVCNSIIIIVIVIAIVCSVVILPYVIHCLNIYSTSIVS